MRTKIWLLLAVLPLWSISCSERPADDGYTPPERTIEVTIGSSPRLGVDTRTDLGDDGISIKWSATDKIALWARNTQGTMQLSGQEFALGHYNEQYNDARFRADIVPMPEDTYTYYALSPAPASVDGTRANYTIPAIQDGAFHGEHHIMAAEAVTAGALHAGDNTHAVNLRFVHKVHLLRIHVPANNLGAKITDLELTFPQAVTGTLTVDAADASAQPVLSAGSNTLTLHFDEPVDAGSTVYALIAPVDMTDGQDIAIKAYSDINESQTVYMAGKNFTAGHTTPIRLTIPEAGYTYTTLHFNWTGTGEQTLGEPVQRITLRAPEGATFDNGSNTRTFAPDGSNRYTMVFKSFPGALSQGLVAVEYESENAVVNDTFTLPQLTESVANSLPALTVPYLMFNDFSELNPSFEFNTNFAGSDALNPDPTMLDTNGLPGWSGARVGGAAGVALRVASRVESGMWVINRRPGRADSAPMTGLKAGRTVRVRVSFDYAGDRYNGTGGASGNPVMSFGHTTTQGAITVGTGMANALINELAIGIDGPGANGSWYGQTPHNTVQHIPACTPQTRLTWFLTNNRGGAFAANGNYWLYIDNIKVSIANE